MERFSYDPEPESDLSAIASEVLSAEMKLRHIAEAGEFTPALQTLSEVGALDPLLKLLVFPF